MKELVLVLFIAVATTSAFADTIDGGDPGPQKQPSSVYTENVDGYVNVTINGGLNSPAEDIFKALTGPGITKKDTGTRPNLVANRIGKGIVCTYYTEAVQRYTCKFGVDASGNVANLHRKAKPSTP